MTSKEALEYLYHEREKRYNVHSKHENWSSEIEAYDKVGDCLTKISQDLERLEKIENEFKKLKKMGMGKFYFPYGRTVILGFDITKDEEEKYNQIIKDSFSKILNTLKENE